MPGPKRSRRARTDEWASIKQWTLWPEQTLYEEIRPIILFGQTPGERAKEIDAAQRTLSRKADEFEKYGMQSLFATQEPRNQAAYLQVNRKTASATLQRWAEEEFAGLPDKSKARKGPPKVTLKVRNEIRKLQENPRLGRIPCPYGAVAHRHRGQPRDLWPDHDREPATLRPGEAAAWWDLLVWECRLPHVPIQKQKSGDQK